MNKKTKNKIWIVAVSLSIIASLIVIGNYTGLFSISSTTSTAYSQIQATRDNITYSSITENQLSGFTNQHLLISSGIGQMFECGANTCSNANKNMFKFFLEMNGIDSSYFSPSFVDEVSVFSPNGYSGNCPNPVGNNISEISNLGFTWDTNCAWQGRYSESVLNEMTNKMSCYVDGNVNSLCFSPPIGSSDRCSVYNYKYHIPGTVSYMKDNGFICNIDVSILKGKIPSTITDSNGNNRAVTLIGVSGVTVFIKKPEKIIPENNTGLYIAISLIIGIIFILVYILRSKHAKKR